MVAEHNACGAGLLQESTELPESITFFNLETFEWRVHTQQTELACRELVFLLTELERMYGQFGESFRVQSPGPLSSGLNRHICTRLAGAITTLFSRPGFGLSDEGWVRLMDLHRCLALIFAVSSYRNGDHIIRNLNAAGGGVAAPLTLNAGNLRLFCLCYYPDSDIALQPEVLWQYDRETVVRLFCVLISGRALPTVAGHAKRELLLAWLPDRLAEAESLDFLPVAVLHDVYMHCSYADFPGKHLIKRPLNRLIARRLEQADFAGLLPFSAPPRRDKPLLVVIPEWFTCQHSIYRTHSATIRALKTHFHVMGLAQAGATDDITQRVFDEFVEVPPEEEALAAIVACLAERLPDVLYYPSVGMFPVTLYLTNLRLAPLQLMALGHPATTYSECIDGVLAEEDYLGDPGCFSEQVCPLPKDAMPYLPPEHTRRIVYRKIPFTERRAQAWPFELPVRVAVCASLMKINPGFLSALAEVEARCQVPVQFCFYTGMAQGLTLDYIRETVCSVLAGSEVNGHMAVQDYQTALNSCELFANPFPFGNTNGLVDTVRQGLPGVCMTGAEVHAHIDEGLFRRLGLPEALIAPDRENYIRAVVRLVEDTVWRESLQAQLLNNDPEQVLFRGHPEKFVDVVKALWDKQVSGMKAEMP